MTLGILKDNGYNNILAEKNVKMKNHNNKVNKVTVKVNLTENVRNIFGRCTETHGGKDSSNFIHRYESISVFVEYCEHCFQLCNIIDNLCYQRQHLCPITDLHSR